MDRSSQQPFAAPSVNASHSEASTASAGRDTIRRLRISLLCTIILLEIGALIWLLPSDPLIAHRIQKILHPTPAPAPPDFTPLLRNDPVLGSMMPTVGAGKALRQVGTRPAWGYLVVPVGDCASCISADLSGWQREAPKHGLSLVLISSGHKDQIDHFRRDLQLTVPIVSDPGDDLAHKLNTLWYGRPYLFSSDWHLRWMPQDRTVNYDPFKDSTFLSILQGAKR